MDRRQCMQGLGGIALGGLPALGRASRVLPVYGDDKYPPIVHLQDGRPAGFLVELLQRLEALTGDRYRVELMPWKRAFELSKRGEAGLVGVSLTQERLDWFDFSEPLYMDEIRVVVRRGGEFPFRGIADLKGKVVGGVIGASYGDAVDRAIREGLFRVERDLGVAPRLRKLLMGRMDAALVGNGVLGFESVLRANPDLQAQRDRLVLLPKALTSDALHLAFPKSMNEGDALQRVNRALAQLQAADAKRRAEPASR